MSTNEASTPALVGRVDGHGPVSDTAVEIHIVNASLLVIAVALPTAIVLAFCRLGQWSRQRASRKAEAGLKEAIVMAENAADLLATKGFRGLVEAATGAIEVVPVGRKGRTMSRRTVAVAAEITAMPIAEPAPMPEED